MNREQRTAAFRRVAARQPGCTPYDNRRRIHVRQRMAGQTLEALLAPIQPYERDPEILRRHHAAGEVRIDGKVQPLTRVLVAGNVIEFVLPDTVEPPVATGLSVLFEDEALLVVDKPAPLPIHPCGRYNKNTLIALGAVAWPDITLKPVHRLDANTTGVMVLAKSAAAARALGEQFSARQVLKTYSARVHGVPAETTFEVRAPIERDPSVAGTRVIVENGQEALTCFELEEVLPDQTALLRVVPETGRTNQIRLHLRSVALPIVGDTVYRETPALAGGFTQDESALCLHARTLSFAHPTHGQELSFTAALPPSFRAALPPSRGATR
jgi:RluA family pseudouridine synthase